MYRIDFYSSLNELYGEEFFIGKDELKCITTLDIDEDKLIDDEFFSFEAKKMRLSFVDDNSSFATKMKSYINATDYLTRNYPQTLEGIETSSVITQFINRKISVRLLNDLDDFLFCGVLDASSISIDYESKTYSVDIVSIAYLLFDNFEELSELNMFETYLANDILSKPFEGNIYPQDLLAHLICFVSHYGIHISESIFQIDMSELSPTINLDNSMLMLYNRMYNFAKQCIVKNTDYNLSYLQESAKPVLYEMEDNETSVKFSYQQKIETITNIPIRVYCVCNVNGQQQTKQVTTLSSHKFSFLTKLDIDIDKYTFAVTEGNLNYTSILDLFHQGQTFSAVGGRYYLYLIDLKVGASKNIQYLDLVLVGNSMFPINDSVQQNALNIEISNMLDTFENTCNYYGLSSAVINYGEGYRITAFNGIPRMFLSGNITPMIKIKTAIQPDGSYMVTNESHGVMNPDVFNTKEFFKCLLLLSFSYFFHGYKRDLVNFEFKAFNIPTASDVVLTIQPETLLKLSSKTTYIDLNKAFLDIDFSETDWHYLIRGIIYRYKSIAGQFQKIYSCEVLKPTWSDLSLGSVISIPISDSKTIIGMINSFKEEEDYYSFELIEILS